MLKALKILPRLRKEYLVRDKQAQSLFLALCSFHLEKVRKYF